MKDTEKIIRCPICEKIVALQRGYSTQKIERVNGLCWDEFGYSLGGWGSHKNFMRSFRGEVCEECFQIIKIKIDELQQTIKSRRGASKEGVCIYKEHKDEPEGNTVPELPTGKLQPKRYRAALLRVLSLFS